MRGSRKLRWGVIWWLSVALFALNVAVAWRLFHIEYLSQTGSGESLTIAYARYARDHWPDLGWCRFWFGGMPFQNAYVPGLLLTTSLVSWLGRLSAARAFHIIVACMYCMGPVTLFWLACRLTRTVNASFCAALAYSLLSPSAFLVPEIHDDLGSFFWDQRLHVMDFYGDNPHVSSLTLLPLAILALDAALEKRRPIYYVLAALALAAVPLTNWPGAIALACAIAAYALTYAAGRDWLRIACLAGLAYAFAISWIPPSTILTTQSAVQGLEPANRFNPQHLLPLAALAAATALLLRVLRNTPKYLRFFILYFFYTGAITLGWYWLRITLLAQPNRFHLAMEMGFTLSAIFALRLAWRRWADLAPILAVAFTILCVVQFVQYRRYAHRLLQPVDITKTSEYKTTRWFDEHMRGSRVMVPGSTTFWMNVFTDTPQLEGCCLQSIRTPMIPIAIYGIDTDLTAENRAFETSLLWFKALGVRAVAVSGPRSTEVYKPFYHPHKFDGRLKELWRDGDDVIFEVPWRYYSIAHAMNPTDLVARTPIHGVDTEPLAPYVAAIDRPDAPDLQVQWPNNETMSIMGSVKQGQVISVQENWHPGWHASVNGAPRPITVDKLGFMTVAPQCNGNCTIDLHYDGGAEMTAAHWIQRAAMAGSLLWILLG